MLSETWLRTRQLLRFTPLDSHSMPQRRIDLDWLRIILFALVILHHVGMFYTSNWGWHAKSQYRSEWLESALLILEPWRMPAIWLISGIAIRFVLAKVSLGRFVALRTLRLLLPLLFGILIIVPPQLYVEMTLRGEIDMGYGAFMMAFLQPDHPIFARYTWGIWPHIDVNHLWYLRSLWYYSMYMIVLLPLLNSRFIERLTSRFAKLPAMVMVSLLTIPIIVIQLVWGQGEWRYPVGFLFLLYGYLLGWQPQLWERLQSGIYTLLGLFSVATIALIYCYNTYWLDIMKGGQVTLEIELMIVTIYSTTRIAGVLLLLATTRYLSRTVSSLYHYCNDAVYPFYILHQSVIIVLGYQLNQLPLGPVMQPIMLTIGTLALCIACYEVIRRVDLLRPCFGLTVQGHYSNTLQRLGYISAALMISPLLVTLIL